MEHGPFIDGLPINSMVIFHGYVSHNQRLIILIIPHIKSIIIIRSTHPLVDPSAPAAPIASRHSGSSAFCRELVSPADAATPS